MIKQAANSISLSVKEEADWLLGFAHRKRARSILDFAEAEVRVPSGKYKGERFRAYRQPFVRLLYAEYDSGRWNEITVTGPSQSGKTLAVFAIPILYHLIEMRETVCVGVPDLEMSSDKWDDIKPVLESSGFEHLMPTTGQGSRGSGKVTKITLTSGATLRFLTGGGGDKSRAGYTTRVLIITEVDGFDESGEKSRESDKVTQMQARQKSYSEDERLTLKECTVSTTYGRTWREYDKESSRSVIMCPCPHCGEHVAPERENLVGWKAAKSRREAKELGHWECPACAHEITEAERRVMNEKAVLAHKGQTVTKGGKVIGPDCDEDRLGFRWSAFNNMFRKASDLAALEWTCAQYSEESPARLQKEKELLQFEYAMPCDDEVEEVNELDHAELMIRTGTSADEATPLGVIPADHDYLACGVDLRARQLHYVVKSSDENASCRVIQYGELKVFSNRLGQEPGLLTALRYLRDNILSAGFQRQGTADRILPDLIFVDSGWKPKPVFDFALESRTIPTWDTGEGELQIVWPIKGDGRGKQYERLYTHPQTCGDVVKILGPDLHVRVNRTYGQLYIILDAGVAKGWSHARWATPLDEIGACSIHVPQDGDHEKFFKHITAERAVEEFIEGQGTVIKWIVDSKANHYLDADGYASAALRWLGVEPIESNVILLDDEDILDDQPEGFTTPDGRSFY